MLSNDNKVVQSLWIGKTLSPLELLTLKSFIYHGHEFHLYLYETLETSIPKEVVIKNANTIIPSSKIFRYKHNDPISKQGKGSVAGFSDIFRYKLLYEKGGWWVDMDVTCLKSFDINTPYVFRKHDFLPVVGNIMKCPPKSQLMKDCYEVAQTEVGALNNDWLKPIRILNNHIEKLGLTKFIYNKLSNMDRWELIALYYFYEYPISKKNYAIHWVNTAWRKKGLIPNQAIKNTTFHNLLALHGIEIKQVEYKSGVIKYIEWMIRHKLIPCLPNSWVLFFKKYI